MMTLSSLYKPTYYHYLHGIAAMDKSLIKDQNQAKPDYQKKFSVLLLSLVVCFSNGSNWASTIELDNNNFRQYLNADHPVKGCYRLISDIDLSQIVWKPVGNKSVPFSLTLEGNGHVISGLKVSTSHYGTATGLFGSLQNSVIRQILIKRPKVRSSRFVSPTGALVGDLKGSIIEEVVNYAGTIKTTGYGSDAGGLAGSVSDSVIRDSVNTGTVTTIFGGSTGGIAGLANQTSSVSNNLNTGKIISGFWHSSPAGGIVGTLKNNSTANNNMNTGGVTVRYTENSGGIAGKAETARVLDNLNTGKMSINSRLVDAIKTGGKGGIVGQASGQTMVSRNLNTGNIFSEYVPTHVGGIAGQVDESSVVENVNAGTVSAGGSVGGIAGGTEGGIIRDNLNAGAIKLSDIGGYVGGIAGKASFYSTSLYNNVNTGPVEAQEGSLYLSGAVARIWMTDRIENNLDTFTKNQSASLGDDGRNTGIKRLSKTALKSDLSGLNSTLWNAGDATQLPMLKSVNTPYRDLARIDGTQQTNNQFPTVLNEFADPGGETDATSFNRTIWNGRDGYLPFPKVFYKPQTLLAGIDCTQGGFDCREDKNIVATPSVTPSSSARLSTVSLSTASRPHSLSDSESASETSSPAQSSSAQHSISELDTTLGARTLPDSESPSEKLLHTTLPDSTSSTTHSANPLDNCPPLKGTPLYQAYDPVTQRIYVVIQPGTHYEELSEGVILARYKGTELDKQFGLCGVMKYTPSDNHAIMLDPSQSLVGQVIQETTGSFLNLVVTTDSGKTTLLEFPLSAIQGYQAQFTVNNDLFPENLQINDATHHQGFMYLTGTVDDNIFIGHYHQQQLFYPIDYAESSGQYDEEQGLSLRLSPDGERLYVTGKSDRDTSYQLFIRQFDSSQLSPIATFGDSGKEIIPTNNIDRVNIQQDILIQKDQVYVATFSPEKEQLSIRRFATENGQMDSAFMIDDSVGFPSRTSGSFATVRLVTTEDYSHAIIYTSDGQMSVVTYKDQANINRFDTTFKPAAVKSMRPVFVGNKVYLSVQDYESEKGSRHVQMQEIFLHPGNYNHQKPPAAILYKESPSSFGLSRKSSGKLSAAVFGLGIGLITASTVMTVTIAIVIAIKTLKKQPPLSAI
ncbi:hypothetical protein [Endozoicomonas sp. ALC020]|uniref:hypothetical protein n=1 Tax=unclassified Endozoicomonas TaxID=2644528 RepID=UPI003BB1CB71